MNLSIESIVTNQSLSLPRVCIFAAFTDLYVPMAAKTIFDNKAEYARRWHHDLKAMRYDGGEIGWDRLRVAVEIAKSGQYDWIYVVGADTLITNMTIPLTTIIDDAFHFIIANDINEWNADSILIRCSPSGLVFMDDVLGQYERLKNHFWNEQQAMIEQRDQHLGLWKVLPQRRLNAYNYLLYSPNGDNNTDKAGHDGQWQPGDFLIHWAGRTYDERMLEIDRVMPMIVR